MKKEWIWLGMLAATGMGAMASGQGLPPGPMPDANGESGSGRGSEGGESCSKCSGKKSGSKDGNRSGSCVGESFRAFGVLDGPGGYRWRWSGRGYAVSVR
jgi:hypothetical protein